MNGDPAPHVPNPRRVAAGRRNVAKRRGLTPEGRARLRAAALANRPWRHSTGPRTARGRMQSVLNGKRRQKGPLSVRELRAEVAGFHELRSRLAALRLRLPEAMKDLGE
jgi:hypothetical protein